MQQKILGTIENVHNAHRPKYSTLQWRSQGVGGDRLLPPPRRNFSPSPMKSHFVQRSMESRHFESQSAPLLTPEPLLSPLHFEKSGYTPGRGDPGELSHLESWSTPIIFKTSHLNLTCSSYSMCIISFSSNNCFTILIHAISFMLPP